MRGTRPICTLMIVALCAGSVSARTDPPDVEARRSEALLTSAARHVRAATPIVASTIAEGVRRSPTFADLVSRLNASDVIVYVEGVTALPTHVLARMSLLGAAPRQPRYLRVQILMTASLTDRIALLGHELQHALEVAASPEVVDEASLARLYGRIGERHGHTDRFDTAAARATGSRVRREVSGVE